MIQQMQLVAAAQELGRAMRDAEEALGTDRYQRLSELLASIAQKDSAGNFTLDGMQRIARALDSITVLYLQGEGEAN
jgi:pilus assembly protein TadC